MPTICKLTKAYPKFGLLKSKTHCACAVFVAKSQSARDGRSFLVTSRMDSASRMASIDVWSECSLSPALRAAAEPQVPVLLGRQGAAAQAGPFGAAAAALPDHDGFPALQFSRRRRAGCPASTSIWRARSAPNSTSPTNARSRRCPGPNSTTRCSKGEGEAIIAGIAVTPETRAKYAFSRPICSFRRASSCRRPSAFAEPIFDKIRGKRIGVHRRLGA